MSALADVENLLVEGRYGHADLALRRLEALIPTLAQSADAETLLLALYGRALLLRQLRGGTQGAIAACDVLERAAHERQDELWVATAYALRARFRVDSGDIGGATADLARADADVEAGQESSNTGYRLLDGLALVYAGLRLHDRADEVRTRIERTISARRTLDQAQHWSTWSGELAARAMEPLAGGAPDPQHELMAQAVEIAARLDGLPEDGVPPALRRGARGVRALAAAYRGRPSEALRLLGPDAFGTVGDLPPVERQIVSLAAMRAHALVGSLATARSLDDAATTPPATLPNLVLEVCRTRERLWLETYAGGDVIPVLHRMTELLVRLGWRGMDLVADTARQALEHQALRTESRTDALTGVGNRRALDEELRQLLRFGPLPLALILVDIDHFKDVNDAFTHVVGDEVLRRVAASLSLQLRTDDELLRYGGDEFVVLLPGTGDEEANAVAERMAAAVAARPWNELADGLPVTVTTGVAAVWSLSGRRPDADAEKLFRRADERLLHAKRARPQESRGDRHRPNDQEPPARSDQAAFEPDPEVDLDVEPQEPSAGHSLATPGPSGRRSVRNQLEDHAERLDQRSDPPARSRREARAAGRTEAAQAPETSASRDAAEAEAAAREVSAAEAAEHERAQAESRAEQARREAEARAQAEQARREAEIRAQIEQAQAARERRKAESRAAERIREEAYARAAEQARAAERERLADKARAAERARAQRAREEEQAAEQLKAEQRSAEQQVEQQVEQQSAERQVGQSAEQGGALQREAPQREALLEPVPRLEPAEAEVAGPPHAPLQRRAPLYDMNQTGPQTTRQAIIDLSSRKKPRNPYTP